MGTATLVKLDELLWLGRYMERVYQSINMYKMTYDQLIDQDASFYKNECERMGIPDTFDSPQDFAWRIAFDTEHPLSIITTLYRAYDNAMILRDEITSETLAYIHLALAEMKRGKTSEAPLMELQLVEDLVYSFWGCLDDKVHRQSVRNTVKVGKYLERLDVLLRREPDREDLSREINRLASKIDTTDLPYNRTALLYAIAMIEDEDASFEAIKEKVWEIIPPFL
ncbi:MAG: alpha-E domain-containing protein [Mogibacterium sp.]|nr:alpha-E domain-containing protein [Mogibacterium sp.]